MVATFLSSLPTVEEKVPKIMTILKQEMIHRIAYAGDAPNKSLLFVSLKTSFKPQSVVERKSLWKKSYYATALIGVEVRISNIEGRSLATDFVWQPMAATLPKMEDLKAMNLNAEGRSSRPVPKADTAKHPPAQTEK